jgi:hypothetical protein
MKGSKKCFKKGRSGIGGKQENTEMLVEDVAGFEFGRVEVGLDVKTARREEINEERHADKTIFSTYKWILLLPITSWSGSL